MQNVFKYGYMLMFGGITYGLIEVLWRGYTHISMVIIGGMSFAFIGMMRRFLENSSFLLKCVTGALFITVLEFFTGLIVNVWLQLGIWDYANLPFNIMGQICPTYLSFWIVLSGAAMYIERFVSIYAFGETVTVELLPRRQKALIEYNLYTSAFEPVQPEGVKQYRNRA